MKGNPLRITRLILILSTILLFTSCSGTQIEELPPEEILARSAERMRELAGFHYRIERSGASAFLDYNETISFRRAEGDYVLPDRVTAEVRVIAPGIIAEVSIISIGGTQWETNYLTGEWQVVPPEYAFQPQILLNPDTGIQAVMERDLISLTYEGIEEIEEMPGFKLYKLHGLLEGEGAYNATFGMIDKDLLDVQLWIAPRTFELHRVVVIDPAGADEDEDTIWQIDFWAFDKTIRIEAPPIETD
jgi:hypothetical protein